jgi:hypothetical protein
MVNLLELSENFKMKYIYKSWNSFTTLDSQIRLEDEFFRCNRVYNDQWKNKEYKKAFQDEIFDVSKIWVNLSVEADRISNLKVDFRRAPQNLYIMLGMASVLFLFSHLTNSLYLFNTIIYFLVILSGLIFFILGQTIVSFDVKSIINGKSYKFECRSLGNDKGLISFVQNLKDELKN